MGIFAKQGPYQEFKPLFVKEFDADKTVDRLNKVEADMNVGKEAIKRFDALNRETGKVDVVMNKYQQSLNAVANDPNASIWSKANAVKQLGTSYANDPERLAVATSKQNAIEMAKENAAKADAPLAVKKEELDLDYMGGSGVDAQGNIRTFRKQYVPKDVDPNTVVNLIGSGFATQGINIESDPKSGVEGYWETTTDGRIWRSGDDIKKAAKQILSVDEDTRRHYELVAFDKLHDDYTTLFKQQGLPQLEAERMATGKLYEEQKDASGNPIKGSSILDKAVDSQLNTVAEAAVTKFTTNVIDRKINPFQKVKTEGAGAGTDASSFPVDAITTVGESTKTEGVPEYDVEGKITDETYKEYKQHSLSRDKALAELNKNAKVKALVPELQKYLTMPNDKDVEKMKKSESLEKIKSSLFDKIVGKFNPDDLKNPVTRKIYDAKMATYNKALSDMSTFINENTVVAENGYDKEAKRLKEVLKINFGYNDKSLETHQQLKEALDAANRNAREVTNTLITPSVDANNNTKNSIMQTLSDFSVASFAAGEDEGDINEAIDNGDYEEANTSGTDINNIDDLKQAMKNTKDNTIEVAGIQFNVSKKLNKVVPQIALNINSKFLYIKPSGELVTALTPLTYLETQRHNPAIAKKASPTVIKDLKGNNIKVKFKYKDGTAELYNTETNKYVDNWATILKMNQEKVLKSHSTFYAAESPYDPVTTEKTYKTGGGE